MTIPTQRVQIVPIKLPMIRTNNNDILASNTSVSTVTKPDIPTVTRPDIPTVTRPANPPVTRPNIPTVTRPDIPTVTRPVIPTATKPVIPTVTKPVIPTVTKPVIPTVTRPVIPTVTRPDIPPVTKPVIPTVTKTVIPTVTKLGIPTVTKPVIPTVTRTSSLTPAKPSSPTAVKPSSPTAAKPSSPTAAKPSSPTAAKQVGPPVTKPGIPPVTKPGITLLTKPGIPLLTKPGILPFIKPSSPTVAKTVNITFVKPLIPTDRTITTQDIVADSGKQHDIFTPDQIDDDTIINTANGLNKESFNALLKLLGDAYHNDESLVSDATYDELVDIYEAKYGAYTVVGAEPSGEKVDLPHYLGSLRKLKKDNELATWLQAHPGPYIIEDKIDGLTLLLVSKTVNRRRVTSLYTRGGGIRGVDVSHLLQYIPLPNINTDISVRGEVVMTRDTFMRVGGGFKNARNLVSGIVISKKQFNPMLARELSFFAYRILSKKNTPEQDISELRGLGFSVPNPVATATLSKQILDTYFEQRKTQSPYEMDGLVIYQNIISDYPVGEAPRHVVAFKTGTETAVVTVTDVVWEASKDRLLKPVVHYETISLSGADLSKASGYNARFIVLNKIGPGAKILITRSGDVIPKILSIISPSPNGPKLPNPALHGKYDWNENEVELVAVEDNDQVYAKQLKHFIETLGVKNMGPGRIRLLVDAGIKDINTLLSVTPAKLITIDGIGETIANQFYQDIHAAVSNVSLATIMDASGVFPNVGERRFDMIIQEIPNFLDVAKQPPAQIAAAIRRVKGFDKLSEVIANSMAEFLAWLSNHKMITVAKPINVSIQQTATKLTIQRSPGVAAKQQANNISGKTIVFSGFRDKELEGQIIQLGGKVTTAVSGNTSLLVIKDMNDRKGKAEAAEKKGIPIIDRETFIRTYL
jgi:DNA ligase (NAD+)